MGVKVVKTKMIEKEVQSPGRRGGALLGREKQHTEPPHHPLVLPHLNICTGCLQKRFKVDLFKTEWHPVLHGDISYHGYCYNVKVRVT